MGPVPPAHGDATIFVGVDIAGVDQVAARMSGRPGLAELVFTERELGYAGGRGRRAEHLAARFAAKEAVFKALGGALPWRDVEVVNGASGRPRLRLHGAARAAAERKGIRDMEISLSHTDGVAIAFVVLTTASATARDAIELVQEAAR
ncbi:holo-ACP synthase [Nocardia cyriacigeorgica]|uniref:holo-ACP synthase n=1 Tax=Nocardia cyriacigeorgica TaxID=135487 RepID=UPI001895FD1B|nr:holo-ACP synthase [Nocardia cyriacigeorgica]MBF6498641.1 holo-ACP synthase [Nocardia cyriacigeorgica]